MADWFGRVQVLARPMKERVQREEEKKREAERLGDSMMA